ncbi:MAG: hypothetical protein QOJ03_3399 [Frankiaceae bacterium]|nr:hypothetical protein [Frankiaceae bacterium]
MSRNGGSTLACDACGFLIPSADFLIWPDDLHSRVAICPACAAVSTVRSSPPPATPPEREAHDRGVAACEVFLSVTDGWVARCDCGATAGVVNSQREGWSWMLAHDCTSVTIPPA